MSFPGMSFPASFGGMYIAQNPFLSAVLRYMPSQRAAYSQDINAMIYNYSGQALPTWSFPNFSPFGFWQGGIIPGFRDFGLM